VSKKGDITYSERSGYVKCFSVCISREEAKIMRCDHKEIKQYVAKVVKMAEFWCKN